jgi:hypothetical protein
VRVFVRIVRVFYKKLWEGLHLLRMGLSVNVSLAHEDADLAARVHGA